MFLELIYLNPLRKYFAISKKKEKIFFMRLNIVDALYMKLINLVFGIFIVSTKKKKVIFYFL